MRFLTTVLCNLLLASLAFAQTVPTVPPVKPVQYDSVVLTWAVPTAAPADIAYIIEVLGPGGTGWGAVAIVRGETTFSMDGLAPGVWSFRVRSIVRNEFVSAPSVALTKNVVPPTADPPMDPV